MSLRAYYYNYVGWPSRLQSTYPRRRSSVPAKERQDFVVFPLPNSLTWIHVDEYYIMFIVQLNNNYFYPTNIVYCNLEWLTLVVKQVKMAISILETITSIVVDSISNTILGNRYSTKTINVKTIQIKYWLNSCFLL